MRIRARRTRCVCVIGLPQEYDRDVSEKVIRRSGCSMAMALCRKQDERSGRISGNAVIISLRELGPVGGAGNEMFDDVVILCAHSCGARHERCEGAD